MDTFGKWKGKDVNSRTFDSGSQAWTKPGLPPLCDEERRCHLRNSSLAHLADVGKLSESLKIPGSRDERPGEQTETCALCSDQEMAYHLTTSL